MFPKGQHDMIQMTSASGHTIWRRVWHFYLRSLPTLRGEKGASSCKVISSMAAAQQRTPSEFTANALKSGMGR